MLSPTAGFNPLDAGVRRARWAGHDFGFYDVASGAELIRLDVNKAAYATPPLTRRSSPAHAWPEWYDDQGQL